MARELHIHVHDRRGSTKDKKDRLYGQQYTTGKNASSESASPYLKGSTSHQAFLAGFRGEPYPENLDK